jgi:acetyl-CoA synthetase
MKREDCGFMEGRDFWYQDELEGMSTDCPVEWVDAEDPLFTLYTSGSTGTLGVVHTTGGYMVGTATTFEYVFDYQPGDTCNLLFECRYTVCEI